MQSMMQQPLRLHEACFESDTRAKPAAKRTPVHPVQALLHEGQDAQHHYCGKVWPAWQWLLAHRKAPQSKLACVLHGQIDTDGCPSSAPCVHDKDAAAAA